MLCEGFLFLTSGSETDEGVCGTKLLLGLGIESWTPGPNLSTLTTRLGSTPDLLDSQPGLLG